MRRSSVAGDLSARIDRDRGKRRSLVDGKGTNVTDTPPPPGSYAWQVSRQTHGEDRVEATAQRKSGWTGWLTFAALMMMLVGVFQIFNGMTAIFRSGTYVVGEDRLTVDVDYTVWGWVHIVLGLIVTAAGLCLLTGQTWARVVGIVMAVVNAVVNLSFIPAYPVGSVVVIALDVFIVYAIAVHGGELKDVGY